MKKLILVLAILLATPVFALDISLVQHTTGDTNLVDLNYAGADTGNLPRAFALSITIASPAQITAVDNYKIGESNSVNPGFGIYPARIVIESNGTVTSWGSPLADPNDPGAGTGIGTSNIVLEFGSLYVGDGNAPATSGTLCTLKTACNGASSPVNMTANEEDTYRGGVVLEDGTPASPALTASVGIIGCGEPCPGQASGPTPANGAVNVARTTNLSWTAGSDANSHRIYFGPNSVSQMVFVAEQSGTTIDPNSTGGGLLGQGRKYYWRIDEKNSCGITTGVVWDFNTEACYNDPCTARQTAWVTFGRPDCWCYKRNCRGDADGVRQLSAFWVYTIDLTILRAGYNKTDAQLMTIVSNGKPGICADFDRIKQVSSFRVYTLDLGILRAYYNKVDAQVPICDSNLVNFWTN